MSWYRLGTVNVTQGSATVTGAGTLWSNQVLPGDILFVQERFCEIKAVVSDAELELTRSFLGDTSANSAYAIIRNFTKYDNFRLITEIQTFLSDRDVAQKQLTDWMNGVPGGGPNGDGRYPLTDRFGNTIWATAPKALVIESEVAIDSVNSALVEITQTLPEIRGASAHAAAALAAKSDAEASAAASATSAAASATSASYAEDSREQAAASAASAAGSASDASASNTAAANSASASANSASAAAGKATEANSSADLARDWAVKTSSEVVAGEGFGAKKYALDSASHASGAAASDTHATAKAEEARGYADDARDSRNQAEASRLAADSSALAAAQSQSNASASESAAVAAAVAAEDSASQAALSAMEASQAASSVTNGMYLAGSWVASTGYPPTPAQGTGSPFYKVTGAGSIDGISFAVGDSIVWDGSGWFKIDGTDQVTSVAGKLGAVILTKSDVGLNNVNNTSDANKPVSTATQAALNGKLNTTGGTVTGQLNLTAPGSQLVLRDGDDSGNVQAWFQDETGTQRGLLFWDRASDQMCLRLYSPNGATTVAELQLRPDGSMYLGSSRIWTTGTFDPTTKLDITGGTMTGALTTTALSVEGAIPTLALRDTDANPDLVSRVVMDSGDLCLQAPTDNFVRLSGYANTNISGATIRLGGNNHEIWHAGNVASQAEAEAGIDSAKGMSPLRVKQAIEALAPPSTQVGDILYTARDPGPKFLPADGRVYLQSAYPALFAQTGQGLPSAQSTRTAWSNGGVYTTVQGIVYGNGVYVGYTVSQSYGSNPPQHWALVVYSTDGITWAQGPAVGSATYTSVGIAPYIWFFGGAFHVVSRNTGTNLRNSSNGISWASTSINPAPSVEPTQTIFAAGRRIVVGGNSIIHTASWGTWATFNTLGSTQGVAYGNGLFVVISTQPSATRVTTSPDGIVWEQQAANMLPPGVRQSIAFGNGVFSILGPDDCVVSADGFNWTAYPLPVGVQGVSLTFGGGIFVATGKLPDEGGRTVLLISADGKNWERRNLAGNLATSSLEAVAFGGDAFIFPKSNTTYKHVPYDYDTSSHFVVPNAPTAYPALPYIKAEE